MLFLPFSSWHRQRRLALSIILISALISVTGAVLPSHPFGWMWLTPVTDAQRHLTAIEQMRLMPRHSTAARIVGSATSATWMSLGPGNIGGRTRALVIDPARPDVMFAAAAGGGVWKTVDAGLNWTPTGDSLPNLNVNALAMEPGNGNVLYAGTGDGFAKSGLIDDVRGAGIFKTVDGGAHWTRLDATATADFQKVNDIVVSADGRRVYAATHGGVWRSGDGGQTWTRSFNTSHKGGCLDLAIRSDQMTDTLLAACGTFGQAAVYRNTDAAGAGGWATVLIEEGMGRTSLAIAPSNQNVVYAAASSLDSNNLHGLHAVFRSMDGGATWTAQTRASDAVKLNTLLLSLPLRATARVCGLGNDKLIGVGWYANTIAVDPTDAARVWVGGAELFRSDDGGANWGTASYSTAETDAPQYLRAHHHALVFHPRYDGTTNQKLFVAGDGGLSRTDNARAATALGATAVCDPRNSAVQWTSLNHGYRTTQFEHGAVAPDGKSYFGAARDHGLLRGADASGANGWQPTMVGDGGFVAIHPQRPDTVYYLSASGTPRKSTDGGRSFGGSGVSTDDLTYIFPFALPLAIDPSDGERLWRAAAGLSRTMDGGAYWQAAGSYSPGFGVVSAIAVSPTDSNVVLAGTSTGALLRATNGLDADALTHFDGMRARDGLVSSMTFDPTNTNVAYATYAGFGGTHVWRSADGGRTWTGLNGAGAGALPDLPVYCLAVDPNDARRIYVGTESGIFVTLDGGANWAVENSGLPNVAVKALVFNAADGALALYAFTRGRGAWRMAAGALPCVYALSATRAAFGAAGASLGGAGGVNVATASGCAWTAATNPSAQDWITINNQSGEGAGTVGFSVAPNTSLSPRSGTLAIAGRSFSITQAGITDTTPPSLNIVSPALGVGVYTTSIAALRLSGTAGDNVGVTQVSWRNDHGGTNTSTAPGLPSGEATGTTQWTIPSIPLASGLNRITLTAVDAGGNHTQRSFTALFTAPATIVPIAGNGEFYFDRDNVPALSASVNGSGGMAVDAAGNIYVASPEHRRVRKISPFSGLVTTVAGNGSFNPGQMGDGGQATAVDIGRPASVAVDAAGNLFIALPEVHRVRKVAPSGVITTVAGTGQAGQEGFSGDGGPATQARLNFPVDVKTDAGGNLYIADAHNRRVRRVDASTGTITTVAGNGTPGTAGDGAAAVNAQLGSPSGLAFDRAGNLYIADREANRVRRVAPNGIITTAVGAGQSTERGDGGPARAASVRIPDGLACDAAGNLYIYDAGDQRIRRIDAATGIINTVAGGGHAAPGSGAPATAMQMPRSYLAIDHTGLLLIAHITRIYKLLPFLPQPDRQPPQIAITKPTTQPSFSVASGANVTVEGAASDNIAVTHVTWENDRGGGGTASSYCCANGNTNFLFGLWLRVGVNNLTVTAWDAAGNRAVSKLAVTLAASHVIKTLTERRSAPPAAAAQLWSPEGLAIDGQGNLFIAGVNNNRIQKLTPDGALVTVAGDGGIGSYGDGGPATQAALNGPRAIAVDAQGNLYIADTLNHRVRRVAPGGRITTVAGNGWIGFGGDGGAAEQARLNSPSGLAVDAVGNLLIADTGNHRVRRVSPGGIITTVAGSGYGSEGDGGPATQARLNTPRGLALDAAGNLYIADSGNHSLRKVTPAGLINTFAGNAANNTGAVTFFCPTAPAFDRTGNLYVADACVRQVLRVAADGAVTSFAGARFGGFNGPNDDGIAATEAYLSSPSGLAVDAAGNVYVADPFANRILLITPYRAAANVQAAGYDGTALAPESIVAAFGGNLARATQVATSLPLPAQLAGTTVRVRDSAGVERFAPLFFVSPTQVNYLLPRETAIGPATANIFSGNAVVSAGPLQVAATAPGLFTADGSGKGLAAAVVLRVKTDGTQSFEPVGAFDPAHGRFIARPIDLESATDQVFLILYGTGLRGRSSLAGVTANIGEEDATVVFAGAQTDFAGLDQINLRLPRSLSGRGEVEVKLSVDGRAANPVRVSIGGSPCPHALTPSALTFTAAGGGGGITVSSPAGCVWTATSQTDWLSIASGAQNTGPGAVQFNVAPNTDVGARTGLLRIAGQSFTVTQTGLNEIDPPVVAITQPAAGSVGTALSTITLQGTATAKAGIAVIAWSNNRGGAGWASGATTWIIPDIPLRAGANVVTITAYDARGRSRSAQVTINSN